MIRYSVLLRYEKTRIYLWQCGWTVQLNQEAVLTMDIKKLIDEMIGVTDVVWDIWVRVAL
jgi:hypothetical protein